ncbi:MAG: choice-of-anchor tandem repeat NxxGxxAF-containing protein [Pirellulales bacterium]
MTQSSIAAARQYQFINVADSTGKIEVFSDPSLNSQGTVAFQGSLYTGVSGIFAGNEFGLAAIADNTGELQGFSINPSINYSGQIAFSSYLDRGEWAVLRYSPGQVGYTTIASSSGPLASMSVSPNSLSDAGEVVLLGYADEGGSAIYRSSGAPQLEKLADTAGEFFGFGVPAISPGGIVAIGASYDAGDSVLLNTASGTLAPVIDTTGPLSSLSSPTINDAGTMGTQAFFDAGGNGPVAVSGNSFTIIADTNGPISSAGIPAINRNGEFAFWATIDGPGGNQGIFTGPDMVADKVIRTGDMLFGTAVRRVQFSRGGFNDRGDIAFRYELLDHVTGIAIARVVPEPSSALLLLASVSSIVAWRRRIAA